MLAHYIGVYALVEVKNAGNDEELQRNEERAGGAQ